MTKKADSNPVPPAKAPIQNPPPTVPVFLPAGSLPGSSEWDAFIANLPDLSGVLVPRLPKFPVGTTVPERVYRLIGAHPEGISHFIEEAITSFDGDLRALVMAANDLSEERRAARFDTGIRSISGRVTKAALKRIQGIVAALKEVPGMSLAKVLGGLIILRLGKPE